MPVLRLLRLDLALRAARPTNNSEFSVASLLRLWSLLHALRMTGGGSTTQESTECCDVWPKRSTPRKGSGTIQADGGKMDIYERAVGTIVKDDHLQSRRTSIHK